MRRPRPRTVPPRLQQRAALSEPHSRSGRRSPPSPVARRSRRAVVSWHTSSTTRTTPRRGRMKTAERRAPPPPAPGRPPEAPLGHAALVSARGHPKSLARHGAKLAVVSVRPSALQQVWANRASTARQEAVHADAVALGWPAARVRILDEDPGQSGASAPGRHGFPRRLAAVTMHPVGLGLGLERRRLARRSTAWQHVLAVCALCGPLLADQDGVDDASDPNDRLLCG